MSFAGNQLHKRLARIYASLFVALTLVMSVTIFVSLYRFLTDRQTSYIKSSIALLADQIVIELDEGHSLYEEDLIEEFNINWNINILLKDTSGKVIHRVLNFSMNESSLPAAKDAPRLTLQERGELFLCYEYPIEDEDTLIGSLYFILRMRTEFEFLRVLAVVLAIANVVGMLVAYYTGKVTSRGMLRPIGRMIHAAGEINANRLDERLEIPEADDELRSLALTINAMLDRLREAFESQSRFTADASHELRTPLAILQGNTDILARWGDSDLDVRRESIEAIQKQITYMNTLINNLLFLARGDSGKRAANREEFDIAAEICDIAESRMTLDNAHTYKVETPDALIMTGDRGMIRELLYALLDNSAKYTGEGGIVTISCAARDDGVALTVADTGIGMTEEQLAHAFDRFYRADESRNSATGGLGLGLSIVKSIVDLHGGKIEARSVAGGGLTVTCVLP